MDKNLAFEVHSMSKKRDLLGLKDATSQEILDIISNAFEMKKILLSDSKKSNLLSGKSIITLFFENSTRTRLSFELASKYLGATAANISAGSSSVAKGETLIDTGVTIDMMGTDVIIIRHSDAGAPHLLAKNVNASVINAGDGMNEHPTQALLDIMTVIEEKKSLEGLKVAICGDILHSRVVRSNIYGMTKLGAEVHVFGPNTLMPIGIEKMGCTVHESFENCLRDADVVMGLRMQLERQKSALFPSVSEYFNEFAITEDRLRWAKDDVMILHPGPVNRGVEMPTSIVDRGNSFINRQVRNGVCVRMSILDILTRR